ncbi:MULTISPECIES: GAF domain-containing protein [Methanobacterium]|jgi:GAF domain-containing protein|uniref:GAF domain-containing protein n=1 Tax=Methanobacterium veterum TaxID=408577 RepID=A0A9E5A0Q9_9EURY|nr:MULTISPECIES: GAF domain-containing protein [Methanobacterium]MCZ3365616.1 GAF domain-containing protein [Methanobacterium veterum]MCZ3371079.1 GAF domain-containing protein [Methanobacterium veterum]
MRAEENSKRLNKSSKVNILAELIELYTHGKDIDHIKNIVDVPLSFSLKEISDIVLKEAVKLTESKYCYVAYVDPENKDSVGISFTKMTHECDMYEEIGEARFPVRKDGTYGGLLGYSLDTGKSFYIQDVTTHEAAHGIPEGHTPVKQFLSVPVFSTDKITGQIVIGNPKRDYTDKYLEITEKIAAFYGIILEKLL